MRSRSVVPVALLTFVLFARSADAGGLYTSDRGVRALGRGGAFVAGADDLGAIWYNPAGLADAGTSLFADFAWVNVASGYQRKTQVADGNGTVRIVDSPRVEGKTPFLPIPTLAGSYAFGAKKEYTAAIGVLAPYSSITSFPLTVDGRPAPQRYSLVSLDGSVLATVGGYFSYKPIEQLRFGMGVQLLAGTFASKVVFSAVPADRLIGAPEDPSYDALSEIRVGPILAPSANFGIIAEPDKHFRIGLSGQLPFWINAPATIRVQLPSGAPFENARQEGTDARVKFRLPPILRAGVEYRFRPAAGNELRIELAYVREMWSLHDSIDARPENIALYDVTGFPSPFRVAPISLPRNFQDSNSFRAGVEYSLTGIHSSLKRIDLRAGLSYETSAIPREWVSALTYDANKITPAVGVGIHARAHWRMDAVGALVFFENTSVAPGEARVPRVNPVQGNPTKTEAVNGGDYSATALILGLGAQYKF